jgi:hypothetical protein
MKGRFALSLAVAGLITVAPAAGAKLLTKADFAAAMAPLPHGALVYGELASGKIWKVSKAGHRAKHPLTRIRHINSQGLRGLLGLAVDKRGRIFADWTGTDAMIHVAKVWPGRRRSVWSPGRDGQEANGGRLAFAADGRLIVRSVTATTRSRSARTDRWVPLSRASAVASTRWIPMRRRRRRRSCSLPGSSIPSAWQSRHPAPSGPPTTRSRPTPT